MFKTYQNRISISFTDIGVTALYSGCSAAVKWKKHVIGNNHSTSTVKLCTSRGHAPEQVPPLPPPQNKWSRKVFFF